MGRSFNSGISAEAAALALRDPRNAGVKAPPPPLEKDIQRGIVRALRQLGYTVWEMQLGSAGNGAVYCTPGIPDLYVFKPGKGAFWIEVKRPKLGRVSDAQHERHAELRQAGIPVHVVRSLDEVLKVLP